MQQYLSGGENVLPKKLVKKSNLVLKKTNPDHKFSITLFDGSSNIENVENAKQFEKSVKKLDGILNEKNNLS